MKLQDVRSLIQSSTVKDWEQIPISTDNGPSYHTGIYAETNENSEMESEVFIEAKTHSNILVYKNDINLTIEAGMDAFYRINHQYKASWIPKHWNPNHENLCLFDVFWNGNLVDRVYYLPVDSARSLIPMPSRNGVNKWEVKKYEYDCISLLDDLILGGQEFSYHFDETGISIV
jgi:hypothetical protein